MAKFKIIDSNGVVKIFKDNVDYTDSSNLRLLMS